MRRLSEEADAAKISSDQIQKLKSKLQEIDQWKQETMNFFANSVVERDNFKKYHGHYKSLLARSTQFKVCLPQIQDLQKKCSFIDWREKVENYYSGAKSCGTRVTLENVKSVLEEGKEKGFLVEVGGKFEILSKGEDIGLLDNLFFSFTSLTDLMALFEES